MLETAVIREYEGKGNPCNMTSPFATLLVHGVVCRRSENGEVTMNIIQTTWLDNRYGMDWGENCGIAGDHFSLNILSVFLPGAECLVGVGAIRRKAISLYQQFTRDIISTMPGEGGRIPGKQIEYWINRNGGESRIPPQPTYPLITAFSKRLSPGYQHHAVEKHSLRYQYLVNCLSSLFFPPFD